MTRGLYTAAMGMMTSQAQVDVISQNLANASTPGYCKDEALEMSFPQMMLSRLDSNGATAIGQVGTGNTIAGTYTSFDEGADQETGNPTDLALHGNAFFTVQDSQGQTYFTRNGDFVLNQAGPVGHERRGRRAGGDQWATGRISLFLTTAIWWWQKTAP